MTLLGSVNMALIGLLGVSVRIRSDIANMFGGLQFGYFGTLAGLFSAYRLKLAKWILIDGALVVAWKAYELAGCMLKVPKFLVSMSIAVELLVLAIGTELRPSAADGFAVAYDLANRMFETGPLPLLSRMRWTGNMFLFRMSMESGTVRRTRALMETSICAGLLLTLNLICGLFAAVRMLSAAIRMAM